MSSLNPATTTPSQPFESLPDELLLLTLQHLTPFKRARLLSICKKWNQVILHHAPFWQYLTVPNDLPFHLIFTILLAFTYRSGFKLRHVVIESNIHHEIELEAIFSVLEKSGSTLRFLAVLQEDDGLNNRTRKLAMEKLPTLDSLITDSDHENLQYAVAYFILQRPKYGIQDQDDESNGLRIYSTDNISEVKDEDIKWLSKLNYLKVEETGSIRELLLLLEKCQDLKELDLFHWDADEETLEGLDQIPPLSPQMTKVSLQSLDEILLPLAEPSARALNPLLDLDGKKVNLIGFIHSLIPFKALSPANLWLFLPHRSSFPVNDSSFREDLERAVDLLFEQSQSVENLTMDCPGDPASQEHLLYAKMVLEKLCLSKQDDQRADTGVSKVEEGKGQDLHRFFPNLVKLSVRYPSICLKQLLQKLLESRKEHNPGFQLTFLDDFGEEITCGHWPGKNWMD